jgi:adenine-specific DNA-methyltransferase
MLLESADHIKDGRSDADLLCEVLLKLGLDLNAPIEQRILAGKVVYRAGNGELIACLDVAIGRGDAEPLALGMLQWHAAQSKKDEVVCVFRDSAFADDVAKTNLVAILQQHGLSNIRSL